ncbi:MAG: hypothetical protein MUO55_05860 [Candidatus Atribacteria bacterium]|nr:hypothetical protein [Candidatus Atribacteria bacterium]
MKKLLFVLLVVALASYLLVGCLPVTPPAEGEGEGEGESEVVVTIEGAVVIDGKTYVSAGPHDITVTFPAPVAGYAEGFISGCSGDYSKIDDIMIGSGIVLFPDADKKVWTGSGYFGCMIQNGNGKELPQQKQIGFCSPCCASYVEIYAGECEDEACIWFPVIVDSCPPYAEIEITADACECDGCAITFSSTETDPDCAESELCCGDDCSGLASWSINLYDGDPFDSCCDPSVCEEPIASDSGVCPIDFTTECLAEGTYYAVVNLVDKVGLERNYYAMIEVSGGVDGSDCSIIVNEGFEVGTPDCISWSETGDIIGFCVPICPF